MTRLNKKLILLITVSFYINSISIKFEAFSNTNNGVTIIYKKLEKILYECYGDNLNVLIAIEQMNQQIQYYFNLEPPMSLILINENLQPNNIYYHQPKINVYVLVVNSTYQLRKTLIKIYYSSWWDIDAHMILLGLDSCTNVLSSFETIWKFKILSTVFLCYHEQKNIIMLYTFNPFTNFAPYPWTIVENKKNMADPWTLYKRPYDEGHNVCTNLIYDKTKYMNNYKLKFCGVPRPGTSWIFGKDYNSTSLAEKLPYFNAKFFRNFLRVANVTAVIHYDYDLANAKNYDISLTSSHPHPYGRGVITTYPLRQISLVILTQKRPFLSTEYKILSFYTRSILLLLMITFGIYIIALMLNKSQAFFSVILELIRLLISNSIKQPLNNSSIRIYLFGMFWLVIILNATFQGHLATFLTKPERRNIDSIADLKKFQYKVRVHGGVYYSAAGSFHSINDSLKIIHHLNGYEVVLNDSLMAYITSDFRGYEPAFKYQLHVSKPCCPIYQSFIVFNGFPIVKKIDEISFRYAESGLQDYWDYWAIRNYKVNLSNMEDSETAPKIRPITISDIAFIFKFLFIGLGFSFLVFVMEMGFESCKRMMKKIRIKIFHTSNGKRGKVEHLKLKNRRKIKNSL